MGEFIGLIFLTALCSLVSAGFFVGGFRALRGYWTMVVRGEKTCGEVTGIEVDRSSSDGAIYLYTLEYSLSENASALGKGSSNSDFLKMREKTTLYYSKANPEKVLLSRYATGSLIGGVLGSLMAMLISAGFLCMAFRHGGDMVWMMSSAYVALTLMGIWLIQHYSSND